jgi:serine/threonine protein kinase
MLTGVAGSMAYMAPEILLKRGYTYPIDWWSLGVCAYELIFGRRPFRGRTNTALTHSISKDALRFPENADEKCSRAGLHFIKGVSRFFFLLCILKNSFPSSFLTGIPTNALPAVLRVTAWMKFSGIHGSVQLTGPPLIGKKSHRHLYLTCVTLIISILFTTDDFVPCSRRRRILTHPMN